MKKLIFSVALALIMLCGCGENKPQRGEMPVIETRPKHTVSENTYTPTTVEFYYRSTEPTAKYGTFAVNGEPADFNTVTGDRAMVQADTAVADVVQADRSYGFADRPDRAYMETAAPETGDTAVGNIYIETVAPDTAAREIFTEITETAAADTAIN